MSQRRALPDGLHPWAAAEAECDSDFYNLLAGGPKCLS